LALSRQKQGLTIRQALGSKIGIVISLEGLAMVYQALGEAEKAGRLWGASHGIREAIGSPLPPSERTRYKREIEMVRTQLDDEAFDRAWAEGHAMTTEQAVGYALEANSQEAPNG
jgi:hypothetical protein